MSDTVEAPVTGDTSVPALTVVIGDPRDYSINGVTYPLRVVTFGDNPKRSIEVRDLDEADQWDIAEMAGAQLSDNLPWMSRTMVAMSVVTIDGKPLKPVNGRLDIRDRLRGLGRDGVAAAMTALAASVRRTTGNAGAADPLVTAKNS